MVTAKVCVPLLLHFRTIVLFWLCGSQVLYGKIPKEKVEHEKTHINLRERTMSEWSKEAKYSTINKLFSISF